MLMYTQTPSLFSVVSSFFIYFCSLRRVVYFRWESYIRKLKDNEKPVFIPSVKAHKDNKTTVITLRCRKLFANKTNARTQWHLLGRDKIERYIGNI